MAMNKIMDVIYLYKIDKGDFPSTSEGIGALVGYSYIV